MKSKFAILSIVLILLLAISHSVWAKKNKVAQSGMTYLAISMGARESAMGDAGVAITKGINGLWHNPAVLADIQRFAVAFNQVNWLVDTKLYGAAAAYSLGNWGTVGVDLTYMDFGEIIGTQRVDKSVDYRGFITTGDIGVEDYAIGFSYSRRINDRFALGFKVKRLHESLGHASYVVDEFDDPETGEKIRTRVDKEWKLNDWGLDFGTVYDIGWKDLRFAMSMQNFSRDMKYWYEEFQTPMVLRMGLAMDVMKLWYEDQKNMGLTVSVDALHPNDHTERVHVGSELTLLEKFALRVGYKFSQKIEYDNNGVTTKAPSQVESLSFGLGVTFDYGGVAGYLDYAYGTTEYFKDVNRFSIQFTF